MTNTKELQQARALTNMKRPYNDMDPLIAKFRNQAIKECRRYNFLVNAQNDYQLSILEGIFQQIGVDVYIEPNFYCEFGFNLSLGSHIYINHDLVILDCAQVTIGNHVWIGPKVGLYCANHAEDPVRRANYEVTSKPICIKDGVWLGASVVVLPGVTIGENSIIGAGSVVTQDIPANVVVVGNPCQVVRPLRIDEVQEEKKS